MKLILILAFCFSLETAQATEPFDIQHSLSELKDHEAELEQRLRQFGRSLALGGGAVGSSLGVYEHFGQLRIWKSRSFLAVAGASAALVFTGGMLYWLTSSSAPTDEVLEEQGPKSLDQGEPVKEGETGELR